MFKKKIADMFEMVPDDRAPNFLCVKIVRGHFKGVLYHYLRVRMGEGRLSFENYILDNPKNRDVQSSAFTKITGDILVHLLTEEQGEINAIEPF